MLPRPTARATVTWTSADRKEERSFLKGGWPFFKKEWSLFKKGRLTGEEAVEVAVELPHAQRDRVRVPQQRAPRGEGDARHARVWDGLAQVVELAARRGRSRSELVVENEGG